MWWKRTIKCLPLLLPVLSTAHGSATSSRIGDLTGKADVVAVASTTSLVQAAAGLSVTLKVERVLKGSTDIGSVVTLHVNVQDVGRLVPPKGCGLWFLSSIAGQWNPLPIGLGQTVALHSWYLSLPSCAPPAVFRYQSNQSPLEKVISEIAEGAETSRGVKGDGYRLYSLVHGDDSPVAADLARRLSSSASRELRAVGVALQVARGDVGALARMESELTDLFRADSGAQAAIVMSIDAYNNPAPSGVLTLGRLATSSSAHPAVRRAATSSLKQLHTKEALPFFYALLTDRDASLRTYAIDGFSLFRLGIPPALTGPSMDRALDDAMNPGHGRVKGADREYIHLGQFQSPIEESAHVEFYKMWWNQNRGRLGF